MWLEENCKPDDPRTSAKIIVTAYETFTSRTLQEMAAGKAKVKPVPLPAIEPADDNDGDGNGDDDDDASISNALDRSKQYYSRLVGKFGRVVLDEAHKIRNPQTKIAEAVRQFKPQTTEAEEVEMAIHLITATPMLNRGSDYYGYLTMFWRDEFHVSDAESYGDFYFDYYEDTHIPKYTPIYQAGGELDYGRAPSTFMAAPPQDFLECHEH